MATRNDPAPHEQYRLADVRVDDAWVRKHNESLGEVRRLQVSAAVIAVVLVSAIVACVLLSGGAAWSYIVAVPLGLFALGSLAMIAYIPRKMGSMRHTYETGELVPAIVTDVRPHGITLLALVDRAVDRRVGSLPALAVRSIEKLPVHDVRVGERVPCVAVVGNRSARGGDNTWQFITPMPLAWATGDAEAIRRNAALIPDEEWDTVRRSKHRVEEVETTRDGVLPLR